MSEAHEKLKAELAEVSRRYQRARYGLRKATTEEAMDAARAEFKAASIARTKARRALLRSPG